MQQIDTLPPYHALTDIVIDTTSDSLGAMPKALCVYDSIFTPLEQAEPVVRKSLFTHHQLEVKHNHEMEIHHQGVSGWYFGFIALSILMICTYLRTKQIGLLTLLQSAIDHRALGRMLRETNLTHAPDQAPIALLMLLPVTLVGYFFFFSHPENIWYDILHYLLLYVASIVIYFTRNGIFRFIGNAFNNSEAGVIALLFTIRLIRGLKLILTFSKTPKVYLFYYLCILEIVPIIIIIKVVISY